MAVLCKLWELFAVLITGEFGGFGTFVSCQLLSVATILGFKPCRLCQRYFHVMYCICGDHTRQTQTGQVTNPILVA